MIGPSKSVLVYALHSLEYVLSLARFRVFVTKLLLLFIFSIPSYITVHSSGARTDRCGSSLVMAYSFGPSMVSY